MIVYVMMEEQLTADLRAKDFQLKQGNAQALILVDITKLITQYKNERRMPWNLFPKTQKEYENVVRRCMQSGQGFFKPLRRARWSTC